MMFGDVQEIRGEGLLEEQEETRIPPSERRPQSGVNSGDA